MREVLINNRWPIVLPDHKAELPIWPWWEQARLTAMRAAIRPGDTVWDIGAEQGDLSALYGKWVGRTGTLLLVEPVARAWTAIRLTFEANQLSAPVCFIGFASDERTCTVNEIPTVCGWPEAAFGAMHTDPGFQHLVEHRGHNEITQIRLDDLIVSTGRPDVVTIDVEGAELRVLAGAEQLLTELRPTLFVSVHPELMHASYGDTVDELLRHLIARAYEPVYLGFDHEHHYLCQPT